MVTAAFFKANGHVKVSVIGEHAPSVKTKHNKTRSQAMQQCPLTLQQSAVPESRRWHCRRVEMSRPTAKRVTENGGVYMSVEIGMWQVQIACRRMLSRGGLVKKRFIREDLRGVLEPLL
jgi:hypothetical protein